MPRPLTEEEQQQYLAEPHIAVLSVASDGVRPPLITPVWYNYEPGGMITFYTNTQGRITRKTRLIERSGVLSILVQHDAMPYKYVTVEGTVVKVDRPPQPDQMLAIARRYLPEEHAQGYVRGELAVAKNEAVLYTIRPDRWMSLDFSQD